MNTFIEKIKYSIFPFLEFKKKNLSLGKKVYISLNTFMMVAVFLFIGLYLFSGYFYNYKLKTDNMTIYFNEDMKDNEKFIKAIKNAEEVLKDNILYNNNYSVQIYLADYKLLYNYMATPFHIDTVAINLFDHISIRNEDIKASKNRYHFLSKEIVHEVIHTLQAMKYGGWIKSGITLPTWVKEGYAEYIEENKIPHSNPKKFLQNNNNNENYTLWALMIKHAIEKMHKSVDDLHEGKVEYDEVINSLLVEYNIIKLKK